MASDPFARMSDRLLARLGGEAVLRGSVPCNANVEHGVAVTGEYGEVTSYRTLVHIQSALNPRSGDTLVVSGTNYTLDTKESDDGYTTRFFVL
jgi:hypothetical protein